MRLWYSPYELEAISVLGARAIARKREGALLRLELREEHGPGAFGYADLHPWPELGDASLVEQLRRLRDGGVSALSARSLALARVDGEARVRGRHLFEGLVVPPSHFLATDLFALDEAELARVHQLGFRRIKVKVGRALSAESRKLIGLIEASRRLELGWRLDFNSSVTAAEFVDFASRLTPEAKASIEFVEDPASIPSSEWAELQLQSGLAFAVDRGDGVAAPEAYPSAAARWLIVKPAVQEPAPLLALAEMRGWRLAVTSYLDHPVGQTGAAWVAALLSREKGFEVGECGLVSHLAYVANEFSERLAVDQARLVPASGTGLGFDDLLERRSWHAIESLT